MPARFGALGISVLALVGSFVFVSALGTTSLASKAEAPPQTTAPPAPAPATSTPSEPAPSVGIRVSFAIGLDPSGGHQPIPGGGEVWLSPGTSQSPGRMSQSPGRATSSSENRAASGGDRLCLRPPDDWRPVAGRNDPTWTPEDQSGTVFCRSVGSAAAHPIQIQLEKAK